MINHHNRKSFNLNDLLFQLVVAGSLGLLAGIACGVFSGFLVFGILAVVFIFYFTIKRPELALVGILIATASIVFENQLPLFSVGGISLHLPDFLLLGTLGIVAVRWLVDPTFKVAHTPLDLPLLAFLGLALISTIVAIMNSSVDFNLAMREFRVVSYYLTFFIVTNLLREEKQLRLLVRGIFILATIVATAMVIQALIGQSLSILPGRVEALQTQGTAYADVTRVLPPGQSIVLFSLITITTILVMDRPRQINPLSLLQWAILGLAVLASFTRSFWVQTAIAYLLLFYLVKDRNRQKLVSLGLVVMLLSASMLLLAVFSRPDERFSRLVTASSERLVTLVKGETLQEGSLKWRYLENDYALPQIFSNPLLGMGMGARYRPFDPRLDYDPEGWDARRYIHNAHFWLLLKAGPLAYISFLWLSIVFLFRSFKYWRFVSNVELKAYVLGFALTYLGVLIGAVVNPMFVQWYWTPLIGLMMGCTEVIIHKTVRERLE